MKAENLFSQTNVHRRRRKITGWISPVRLHKFLPHVVFIKHQQNEVLHHPLRCFGKRNCLSFERSKMVPR